MTATEELRALLDERGVEYDAIHPWLTCWGNSVCGVYDNEVYERSDGTLAVSTRRLHDTPSQVVNATLGRRKCYDIGVDRFKCSECGCDLDTQDAASCEPTMWVDGVAACPRFCPHCGRKVRQ